MISIQETDFQWKEFRFSQDFSSHLNLLNQNVTNAQSLINTLFYLYLFAGPLHHDLPLHGIVTLSVHIDPGPGDSLDVPDVVPLPPNDPPHAPAGHGQGQTLQPRLRGDGLVDQDLRQLYVLGQTSDTAHAVGLCL